MSDYQITLTRAVTSARLDGVPGSQTVRENPARSDRKKSSRSDSPKERSGTRGLAESLVTITAHLENLLLVRKETVQELREAAVTIGLAAAAKLSHRQSQECEQELRTLVEEMVSQFDEVESVTVYLHASDHGQLKTLIEESDVKGARSIHWMPDASLPIGGCRVDGDTFALLHEPARALGKIRQELMDHIANA